MELLLKNAHLKEYLKIALKQKQHEIKKYWKVIEKDNIYLQSHMIFLHKMLTGDVY